MKILPVQLYPYINKNYSPQGKNEPKVPHNSLSYSSYNLPVHFYGLPPVKEEKFTEEDYERARKYLDEQKKKIGTYHKNLKFESFNLNKLNGIQRGIEVFEGLSMAEIAFICINFKTIAVNRGCNNQCAHCYAAAVPQNFKEDSNTISKMSWEDFSLLMDGIDKLSQRLGFDAVSKKEHSYLVFFEDSDCINLEVKDKEGKIHDFADINLLAYLYTGIPGLFDTAGWDPNNKKLQKRAEKLVQVFSDYRTSEMFSGINISINPFHSLNKKSIQYKNAGNEVLAKKFRDLYVDRMANTLYTFTPLISNTDFSKLGFIVRALPDDEKYPDGYKIKDIKELYKEILDKLSDKYIENLSPEKKQLKDYREVTSNLKTMSELFNRKSSNYVIPYGRAAQFFQYSADEYGIEDEFADYTPIRFKERLKDNGLSTIIDANGKIYMANYTPVATELQLNFKNKDKQTEPLANTSKKFIITKKMISDAMDEDHARSSFKD